MGIKVNERNDYSYLFDSLNNSSSGASNNIFNAIDLSEYYSIKSGAYGKAVKTYFEQEKAESTSQTKDKKEKKTSEVPKETPTGIPR